MDGLLASCLLDAELAVQKAAAASRIVDPPHVVTAAAATPDGAYLFSGSRNGFVTCWKAGAKRGPGGVPPLFSLHCDVGEISAICVIADDRISSSLLVVGGETRISAWFLADVFLFFAGLMQQGSSSSSAARGKGLQASARSLPPAASVQPPRAVLASGGFSATPSTHTLAHLPLPTVPESSMNAALRGDGHVSPFALLTSAGCDGRVFVWTLATSPPSAAGVLVRGSPAATEGPGAGSARLGPLSPPPALPFARSAPSGASGSARGFLAPSPFSPGSGVATAAASSSSSSNSSSSMTSGSGNIIGVGCGRLIITLQQALAQHRGAVYSLGFLGGGSPPRVRLVSDVAAAAAGAATDSEDVDTFPLPGAASSSTSTSQGSLFATLVSASADGTLRFWELSLPYAAAATAASTASFASASVAVRGRRGGALAPMATSPVLAGRDSLATPTAALPDGLHPLLPSASVLSFPGGGVPPHSMAAAAAAAGAGLGGAVAARYRGSAVPSLNAFDLDAPLFPYPKPPAVTGGPSSSSSSFLANPLSAAVSNAAAGGTGAAPTGNLFIVPAPSAPPSLATLLKGAGLGAATAAGAAAGGGGAAMGDAAALSTSSGDDVVGAARKRARSASPTPSSMSLAPLAPSTSSSTSSSSSSSSSSSVSTSRRARTLATGGRGSAFSAEIDLLADGNIAASAAGATSTSTSTDPAPLTCMAIDPLSGWLYVGSASRHVFSIHIPSRSTSSVLVPAQPEALLRAFSRLVVACADGTIVHVSRGGTVTYRSPQLSLRLTVAAPLPLSPAVATAAADSGDKLNTSKQASCGAAGVAEAGFIVGGAGPVLHVFADPALPVAYLAS